MGKALYLYICVCGCVCSRFSLFSRTPSTEKGVRLRYTHMCMYTHTHTHTYIDVCVCVCVCVCIYIYIYHIYTYRQPCKQNRKQIHRLSILCHQYYIILIGLRVYYQCTFLRKFLLELFSIPSFLQSFPYLKKDNIHLTYFKEYI